MQLFSCLCDPILHFANCRVKLLARLGVIIRSCGLFHASQFSFGLCLLLVARARGADAVLVSEPNMLRRNAADDFGADAVVDPNHENVAMRARELTGGRGVDVLNFLEQIFGRIQSVQRRSRTRSRVGGAQFL